MFTYKVRKIFNIMQVFLMNLVKIKLLEFLIKEAGYKNYTF